MPALSSAARSWAGPTGDDVRHHARRDAAARTSGGRDGKYARAAGATLVVTDAAIIVHFNQFLEQALQVD